MKITPTNVFSGVITVVFTIIFGAYLLVNVAVVGFYSLDAYDNYTKYQDAGRPTEGRYHKYLHEDRNGYVRNCEAAVYGGKYYFREFGDYRGIKHTDGLCQKVLNRDAILNWEKSALETKGNSIFENSMWTLLLMVFTGIAAFVLASIVVNLIAMVFPSAIVPIKFIGTPLLAASLWLFWAAFCISAWHTYPSSWTASDGNLVRTEKVFVAKDGTIYSAPNNVFDWTSSRVMQKVSKIE